MDQQGRSNLRSLLAEMKLLKDANARGELLQKSASSPASQYMSSERAEGEARSEEPQLLIRDFDRIKTPQFILSRSI